MRHFYPSHDVVAWGRTHRAVHYVARPAFVDELPALVDAAQANRLGVLAIGLGRSYGDSGLNAEGAVINMTALDRLIGFDETTGILTASAGVSLGQVLKFAVPRGYFLPVTPGTRHVTLAGAVANDVHGKNHHGAGTFGRWVRELTLLRTDGTHHSLREDDPSGLFQATIGGMGLTGVITRVCIQLVPIASSRLAAETIPFGNLDEFFAVSDDSAQRFEYTVGWIDCLAGGTRTGRGLFSRADHATEGGLEQADRRHVPTVPFEAPGFLLNRASISAFNALHFAIGRRKKGLSTVPYSHFFYPLDGLANWNRLYGKRGMYQYQSVVPAADARDATAEVLKEIARAGQGSFLAVIKTFGAVRSPGLMSFPMEGTTLALDFPNRGDDTLSLLARLDSIVLQARGRLYPAKDGRIPPEVFRSGYEALERFVPFVDPGISSSFWRRMERGRLTCRKALFAL